MILKGKNMLEMEEAVFDYVEIGRAHYEEISENHKALSFAARKYTSLKRHGQDPEKVFKGNGLSRRVRNAIGEVKEEFGSLEVLLEPQIRVSDDQIMLYGGDLWLLSPQQVVLEQSGRFVNIEDPGSSYGTALNGFYIGTDLKPVSIKDRIETAAPPTHRGRQMISKDVTLSLACDILADNYSIEVRP